MCFCPSWKVMLINRYIYKHVPFKKHYIYTLLCLLYSIFCAKQIAMCGGHSKIWGYLFNYHLIINPLFFKWTHFNASFYIWLSFIEKNVNILCIFLEWEGDNTYLINLTLYKSPKIQTITWQCYIYSNFQL
jgi:hypothetical protein